jgi:glycosyltransferase involved in cell wall biosynthesis
MNQIEKEPLISVLMPSYNSGKYISFAIESVLNSSYKNFELIITDDNSHDNTYNIAKEYALKDDRIKLFRNERNFGDYGNRNKAASYATGKYLKYVDHDDYIYPNGLEIIVNQMEKYPLASVGFFSLAQNKNQPFPILLTPKEVYRYNFFGPGLFFKAPLSSIILRSSFEEIGGFKEVRYSGDFELWHRMAQSFNFLLIQDHVVWYREHGSQESTNMKMKDQLNYTKIEMYYIVDRKTPLTDFDRNYILKKRIGSNVKQLIVSLLRINLSDALFSLKKMFIYLGWKK